MKTQEITEFSKREIDEIIPAFPPYAPSYDEKELDTAIVKGTRAWADVPDSVAWVREIRGHVDE